MSTGVLDARELEPALQRARQHGKPLGHHLLGVGRVKQATLNALVREQLMRRVTSLTHLPPPSRFGYYSKVDLLPDVPEAHCEPVPLLWRCIRDGRADSHLHAVLHELGDRPLTLVRPAADFGLGEQEAALVRRLRRAPGSSLRALSASCGLSEESVGRLVYALALTDRLRPSEPPGVAPKREPRRSSKAPPLVPAGRRAKTGPPQTAAQLALMATELEGRGRFAEAHQLLQRACGLEPMSPRYVAHQAWLAVAARGIGNKQRCWETLHTLRLCVLKAPQCPEVRRYRARTLKAAGEDLPAFRDFSFIARELPEDFEAVREMRLYRMRKRNAERRQSGLFRRWILGT